MPRPLVRKGRRAGFSTGRISEPVFPAPALDRAGGGCYITVLPHGVHTSGRGRIAQLVEQLTLNQRVLGSSPSAPTTYLLMT